MYMCIVLYMKLIWCTGFQEISAQLEKGGGVSLQWQSTTCETAFVYGSAMGICALCTMWDLWGVTVLHGSIVNWQGQCNGVAWTYGQLPGGRCNSVVWIYGQLAGGSICHGYMFILLYVRLMGVMVLHGSMVNWQGVHLPWVDVHSAICETDEV